MLTQLDIDNLQIKIQSGETPELYYVAHLIEPRESHLDELKYKSVSRFKVIKIKINKITNAYMELMNYKNNPNNYHIEKEECYYELNKKYINQYVVPNKPSGNKDINPRMPSAVYGYVYTLDGDDSSYIEPSPVHAEYTNVLEYGIYKQSEVKELYNQGKLNWKYITLEHTEKVDGIDYKYITSDWYILECVNFPRTEHILINVNDKTAYFMNQEDAFKCIEQLEA